MSLPKKPFFDPDDEVLSEAIDGWLSWDLPGRKKHHRQKRHRRRG
jgi:hypothetical protein